MEKQNFTLTVSLSSEGMVVKFLRSLDADAPELAKDVLAIAQPIFAVCSLFMAYYIVMFI
jgi:hypothetical protein